MEDIIISPFKIEDYNKVYNLWIKVFPKNTDSSYSRESVEAFLRRNPGTSFVARKGGLIVGTVLAGNDGRRGYIHHLGVLAEYRSMGIGKMLLQQAEKALKIAGMQKVHLFVFKDNISAKGFYDKIGYVKRNDIDVYSRNL